MQRVQQQQGGTDCGLFAIAYALMISGYWTSHSILLNSFRFTGQGIMAEVALFGLCDVMTYLKLVSEETSRPSLIASFPELPGSRVDRLQYAKLEGLIKNWSWGRPGDKASLLKLFL